ncbi:MAG: 4-alpha-glucanotransferase [Clostridia bacterium]|nr:4-alpha-glucanotransferase [Clostridia bacterium]
MERGCGVLLPVSSIPNKYGFGCFSQEAYEFVDYLSDLGMKYWQILPLGIVDSVGSPYSSVSAFAGEPIYIDIEKLLSDEELDFFKLGSTLSFEEYRKRKMEALRYVFDKFYYSTNIDKFTEENEDWIYDYAVYMVLKDELGCGYLDFPKEYKDLDSEQTIVFIKTHSEEIVYYIFLQYLFFKQWAELKKYANKKGIKIIGDVPIYCAMDSADVYSNTENFLIDKETGLPQFVSGVPGDYFNAEGQIWNNPLYDYEYMKKHGYSWWIARLKHISKIYDYVRIDHFRGFESYFAVPYGDTNVKRGKWIKGPGIEIFEEFKKNDIKNLILEDLGEISDDVRDLRKQTGLAGMKVMQFAFDGDRKNLHLPHEYDKNTVAYLGTHDNDTFVGFLKDKKSKARICKYLHLPETISNEVLTRMAIENLISTSSNVCVLTMQDILCEGSDCRINTPGTAKGNWLYKLQPNYRKNKYNIYLKELIKNKNR